MKRVQLLDAGPEGSVLFKLMADQKYANGNGISALILLRGCVLVYADGALLWRGASWRGVCCVFRLVYGEDLCFC